MKSKLTINKFGDKEWVLPNSSLHREDGPAVEFSNGSKQWWINGYLHKEDGPAVEHTDGYKGWYLNGTKYTEKEYKYKTRSRKLTKLLK